jgi:hypothetical protein
MADLVVAGVRSRVGCCSPPPSRVPVGVGHLKMSNLAQRAGQDALRIFGWDCLATKSRFQEVEGGGRSLCLYRYIYIYIYVERARERERETAYRWGFPKLTRPSCALGSLGFVFLAHLCGSPGLPRPPRGGLLIEHVIQTEKMGKNQAYGSPSLMVDIMYYWVMMVVMTISYYIMDQRVVDQHARLAQEWLDGYT